MSGCGALIICARSCPHPAPAKARMKTAIHVKLEKDKYLQGREAPRRYIHTSTGITAHEIERREGRDGAPPVSPRQRSPADQKHYINLSCFCNEFPALPRCSSMSPVVQKSVRRGQEEGSGVAWRSGTHSFLRLLLVW